MSRHRVLMCPPTHLPRLAGERSWVAAAPPLDPARALDQWLHLRALVEAHVGPVVELAPAPWASAMTFTRDIGLVVDGHLVALEPHLRRGAFETPIARRALADLEPPPLALDEPVPIDGGTVVADSLGRLLIGATASDQYTEQAKQLEALTGRPAWRVPLAGGRFPHLDMALCDLGPAWLLYPHALGGYEPVDAAWRELLADRPVIEVEPDDGERLACNLVVHGSTAIGPEISDALRSRVEATGIAYHPTPLDELAKAGGGAHCLTLELPT